MNGKTVVFLLITALALGIAAILVSNGPIRLVTIIALFLISFVLQGTIIRGDSLNWISKRKER
ncbi:hypothetical protein G3578_12140 [Brevibacillus sp. SYP-B805]|jgi:hypothetical protein|uniref:hypothetical protein n=1 Tax=Brevibacillus sp. SYP-B805 TaxID=1578199 RepID=UPI0013EB15C1|nr:hypothetical protein [Brevibacillus sp. SYP-B805]NGQ95906.1 hypothetical protein [Brevibacillus sp. SYP-B805]